MRTPALHHYGVNSYILTIIFNKSLETGKVPSDEPC